MVVRIAQVLAAAGLEPWLVARHPRGLGLPELLEEDGPRHPLWGVAAALARGEDAFFSPCDLPDLHVDQVLALVAARAVAVGQPLLGVIPACRADRARSDAYAGATVRGFIAGLPALEVGALPNLNRPPAP